MVIKNAIPSYITEMPTKISTALSVGIRPHKWNAVSGTTNIGRAKTTQTAEITRSG
jgi:hypothetical protein